MLYLYLIILVINLQLPAIPEKSGIVKSILAVEILFLLDAAKAAVFILCLINKY